MKEILSSALIGGCVICSYSIGAFLFALGELLSIGWVRLAGLALLLLQGVFLVAFAVAVYLEDRRVKDERLKCER